MLETHILKEPKSEPNLEPSSTSEIVAKPSHIHFLVKPKCSWWSPSVDLSFERDDFSDLEGKSFSLACFDQWRDWGWFQVERRLPSCLSCEPQLEKIWSQLRLSLSKWWRSVTHGGINYIDDWDWRSGALSMQSIVPLRPYQVERILPSNKKQFFVALPLKFRSSRRSWSQRRGERNRHLFETTFHIDQ